MSKVNLIGAFTRFWYLSRLESVMFREISFFPVSVLRTSTVKESCNLVSRSASLGVEDLFVVNGICAGEGVFPFAFIISDTPFHFIG